MRMASGTSMNTSPMASPDRSPRHREPARRAAFALMRRTIAASLRRVASRPCPVSTTKSARRRFSASGICLARMARNFASLMPGRRSTRSRCRKVGAGHDDDRIAAPRRAALEEQRDIEDDEAGRGAAPCGARKRRSSCRTSGWRIASSRRSAARSGKTSAPSFGRSMPRGPETPGNGRLDRGDRRAARTEQPVDRGIGVMHGNAEPAQHRCRRALAHADRAGEAEDDHRKRPRLMPSGRRDRAGNRAAARAAGANREEITVDSREELRPARSS